MTVFSDFGAWYGWEWGGEAVLDHVNLAKDERRPLRLTSPVAWSSTGADHLAARLQDGSRLTLRYVDARASELSIEGDASLVDVPVVRSGLYRFEDERIDAGVGENLAGVPVTLRRNWRVPGPPMPHGGIVPSPAGPPHLRAYDAFLATAALPSPLATKLIRIVFAGQNTDGSLPFGGGMPLAAWACSKHPGLLEEFRPELTALTRWWEMARREEEVQSVENAAGYVRERRLLGRPDEAAEAEIDRRHYVADAYRDCFYGEPGHIAPLTSAAWTPLWCGLASEARAASVVALMLDSAHFDTPFPFPGMAISEPDANPLDPFGGAVRVDHAFRAIEALARYGRAPHAEHAARHLLALEGDHEAVDPVTGQPVPTSLPQYTAAAAVRTILAERYPA